MEREDIKWDAEEKESRKEEMQKVRKLERNEK